jgi:hypothetical protein
MSDAAKKLLDEALGLPPDERRELAKQLMSSVRNREANVRNARWAAIWAASGCVHLGGNAVEDTEALYDG